MALQVAGKIILGAACGIFPANLAAGSPCTVLPSKAERQAVPPDKLMIQVANKKRFFSRILGFLLLGLLLWYLHTRGLSPVCIALALVYFRGFFRVLYVVASFLVTAALLFVILSFLIY